MLEWHIVARRKKSYYKSDWKPKKDLVDHTISILIGV